MENIEALNKRLIDEYGLFETGEPKFRLIWSDSELEKRLGTFNDFTSEGIFLRQVTEVREVPKYKQWIHHKWVLEVLVPIPEFQRDELVGVKISYEPLWVFETKDGKPLPPVWNAILLIINSTTEKTVKIDDITTEESIQSLTEELFGNETEVGDALAHKEAIIVPRNYKNV